MTITRDYFPDVIFCDLKAAWLLDICSAKSAYFCKNFCNAFMWSECWTNMFSIACFISFDERKSVRGISSNHFSKWERSKLLQFSFSRLASNYNCTKNIPKLSWTFVLTKFSNEGNIWFIAKIHKNHRLAPLSYGAWYRRGKILQ